MTLCEGRVAIVTGAGRGLGRAYALELGRRCERWDAADVGSAVRDLLLRARQPRPPYGA